MVICCRLLLGLKESVMKELPRIDYYEMAYRKDTFNIAVSAAACNAVNVNIF